MLTNSDTEKRLKKLYSALQLDTSDTSRNSAEIYSFSAGIEYVKKYFDELFSRVMWINFNNYTENALDGIMNFESKTLSYEKREEQIENRMKRKFGYFSLIEFNNLLHFYLPDVTYTNTNELFSFSNLPNSKDGLRVLNMCINGYLPVFASSSFSSTPLTFEQWDNMALTVNEIDRLRFRFDNIETWGGLASE